MDVFTSETLRLMDRNRVSLWDMVGVASLKEQFDARVIEAISSRQSQATIETLEVIRDGLHQLSVGLSLLYSPDGDIEPFSPRG